MRGLIVRRLPPSAERQKDADSAYTVFGESVAGHSLVDALLRHGTFDRYYFLCESAADRRRMEQQLAAAPGGARGEVVPIDDVDRLRESGEMVLLSLDTAVGDLAFLRAHCGRPDWPICGLTHALCSGKGLINAIPVFFFDLGAHDAIVCTSTAGQGVLRNILTNVAGHIRDRGGAEVEMPLRMPVIPLGVETQAFASIPRSTARWRLGLRADQTIFLCFGRFSAAFKMDPFPLLLAFSEVAARRPDVLLVLAGDDSVHHMADSLVQAAAELGCRDRVRVLPNVSSGDKLGLYAAADVFVSPSDNLQETFGIAVIEAMAAGLPVIASDWNGYRDSVRAGETGLLVPTRWARCTERVSALALLREELATTWLLAQSVCVDVDALADAMLALAGDPDTRAAMGARGRTRAVSSYDWKVIVAQYEALWDDQLRAAPRRKPAPQSVTTRPATTQPATTQPATTQPATTQPATTQPATTQPVTTLIDHQALFAHYPTFGVTGAEGVRITARGERFRRGELRLSALEALTAPFDPAVLGAVLGRCETAPRAIEALIASLREDVPVAADLLFQHLAVLAKYGLVATSAAPLASSETSAPAVAGA